MDGVLVRAEDVRRLRDRKSHGCWWMLIYQASRLLKRRAEVRDGVKVSRLECRLK